jgi:hypothetical protein
VTVVNEAAVIALGGLALLWGAGGLALLWGAACLTVVDWQAVSPLVSHASTAIGLPATAIAMPWPS